MLNLVLGIGAGAAFVAAFIAAANFMKSHRQLPAGAFHGARSSEDDDWQTNPDWWKMDH